MQSPVLLLLCCCLVPAVMSQSSRPTPEWTPQTSGTPLASFRAVSAPTETVVWAAGSAATIITTSDGGQTWTKTNPPGGLVDPQYRAIYAWDADTAVVMAVDTPAMFFKTKDKGSTWTRTYYSNVPGTFYNGMSFWNSTEGIAFGDPIDGRLLILRTSDAGESWTEAPLEQRPTVQDGQAGFAASNTAMTVQGDSSVFIGLGGSNSTILYSHDRGVTWGTAATGIVHGNASQGVNSVAMVNASVGVAVGGDFTSDENSLEANMATTSDAGQTWTLMPQGESPAGYRSCVAFFGADLTLAVGSFSCDYRYAGDDAFTAMNGSYHAIAISRDGLAAYAVGGGGGVARLSFVENENSNNQGGVNPSPLYSALISALLFLKAVC